MEHLVLNPQKGRLETINFNFTTENTTWFVNRDEPGDIEMIADYDNTDLLIKKYGWNYPVRIYDSSRSAIRYKQKQAQELLRQALQE